MPEMDRRHSLPSGGVTGSPAYLTQLSGISETNENGPTNKTLPDDCLPNSNLASNVSSNLKCIRTAGLTGRHRVIEKLQAAPDGGYGWLIVLASFFSFFVLDGTAYSFGIFFDAFVEEFGGSRAVTAMAGSLLTGCYMSAGPLVSSLVQKFGCRPVSLVGALFSATSLYLSSLVQNTFLHLITYGLCTGIGFGLIYLPAIVAVSSYFERRRAFATGVALCGSGLGAFSYAPLCQMLLEKFGVRQSVTFLAVLVAVIGSMAACVMRPLKMESHVLLDEENEDDASHQLKSVELNNRKNNYRNEKFSSIGSTTTDTGRQRRHGAVRDEPLPTQVLLEPELGRPLVQVVAQDEEDDKKMDEKRNSILKSHRLASIGEGKKYLSPDFPTPGGRLAGERTVSECYTPSAANGIGPKPATNVSTGSAGASRWTMRLRASITGSGKTDLSPSRVSLLMKKDIFYSGSVYRLDQENVAEKGSKRLKNRLEGQEKEGQEEKETSIIKQMLDVSLFAKSRSFVFLALSNFIAFQAFYIPFVYLKQHAQSNVFDGNQLTTGDKAALLLSFVGITNTLGRMLFGWLSDRLKRPQMRRHWLTKHLNALNINNGCLLLASVSTACTPLLTTYTQVSCNCLLFGLCCAAYMCLTSIILVDLLGLDRLTNAFGLICMCRGVGSMIGPPLAGLLCDLSGSYDLTFYAAGFLFFIATLLSCAASPGCAPKT